MSRRQDIHIFIQSQQGKRRPHTSNRVGGPCLLRAPLPRLPHCTLRIALRALHARQGNIQRSVPTQIRSRAPRIRLSLLPHTRNIFRRHRHEHHHGLNGRPYPRPRPQCSGVGGASGRKMWSPFFVFDKESTVSVCSETRASSYGVEEREIQSPMVVTFLEAGVTNASTERFHRR